MPKEMKGIIENGQMAAVNAPARCPPVHVILIDRYLTPLNGSNASESAYVRIPVNVNTDSGSS
jgi:hypothetical protein